MQLSMIGNGNSCNDSLLRGIWWCTDAGFAASSFTVSPTVVPTSPFQLMSPKSPKYTSTQIFEETNNVEVPFGLFQGLL
jgi:hypothetical protein